MTTMTHSVLRFPMARHSFLARAALVLLFWVIAALPVISAHRALDSISVPAAAAVEIATIVVVGWLYVRLTARDCTVDHALFVGIAWLLLDIAAEVATSSHLGKGWFDLIGSPARPALRDLLLFTWVAAPALFAWYPSNREGA